MTSKLWNTDHRQEEAEAAIKKTIADLGVDYLDLYLIHWPVAFVPGSTELDEKTSIQDTWRTLEGFVRANFTRRIGLSNFAKADVEAILEIASIKPYAHEFETHPYLQQQDFVDYHADVGIKVIAYSPLANTNPTYRDDLTAIFDDPFWKQLAEKKKASVAQTVLAWGLQRGTSVIPKSTSKKHLLENLEALKISFSEEELAEISNQDKKVRLNNPSKKWGVELFSEPRRPDAAGRNHNWRAVVEAVVPVLVEEVLPNTTLSMIILHGPVQIRMAPGLLEKGRGEEIYIYIYIYVCVCE